MKNNKSSLFFILAITVLCIACSNKEKKHSNIEQTSNILEDVKEEKTEFKLSEEDFFSISYVDNHKVMEINKENSHGKQLCLKIEGSFYGNYQLSSDRKRILYFVEKPNAWIERDMFLLDGVSGENKFIGSYNLSVMTDFNLTSFLYEEDQNEHKRIFFFRLNNLQNKEEVFWNLKNPEKLHNEGYVLKFTRSDNQDADFKIFLKMDDYTAAEGYFSIGGDNQIITTFDETERGELFYKESETLSSKYYGMLDEN